MLPDDVNYFSRHVDSFIPQAIDQDTSLTPIGSSPGRVLPGALYQSQECAVHYARYPDYRSFNHGELADEGAFGAVYMIEVEAVGKVHVVFGAQIPECFAVVERAVVLATGPEVTVDKLPASLLASNGVHRPKVPTNFKPASGASLPEIMEEFERRLITEELEKCGWNQTECAKGLRVALSTLNQKIQRLHIDVRKKRSHAHGEASK